MPYSVHIVPRGDMTTADEASLRRLFDEEYLHEFGPWEPWQRYGYAPQDVRVLARSAGTIVGHAGWQRRSISVGDAEVTVAGVGGVLVSPNARGENIGRRLMKRVAESLLEAGDIEFGFLGCREQIVPFYLSCGWKRITASERSVGRDGTLATHPPGPPLLVLPVGRDVGTWPDGMIDLRGRAW